MRFKNVIKLSLRYLDAEINIDNEIDYLYFEAKIIKKSIAILRSVQIT